MAVKRRLMLVGASVAALLVLGSAAPALADDNTPISTFTTPETICSYVHYHEDGDNGHDIRVLHQLRISATYDEKIGLRTYACGGISGTASTSGLGTLREVRKLPTMAILARTTGQATT
jgi:hypothetical protein